MSLTVYKGVILANLLKIGYYYKLADFIGSTLYLICVSSIANVVKHFVYDH